MWSDGALRGILQRDLPLNGGASQLPTSNSQGNLFEPRALGVGSWALGVDSDYNVGTLFSTYAMASVGSGYDPIGELPR